MNEGRIPVINPIIEKEINQETIEKQWVLLTGAIQKSLQTNPKTRGILLKNMGTPLSEELPNIVLQDLSQVDTLIANLYNRYQDITGRYLKLSPVPKESIDKDINNSTGVYKSGEVFYGITPMEKSLIAQRYRYARDIKILTLAAELFTSPVKPTENQEPVITEHGCKIFLTPENTEITKDLLNPIKWEKRTQLKDRVYEITVNGKKFILKERKTSFHTDTKKGEHRDGLSAKEEFKVAQDLNTRGRVKFDRVIIDWEKPLGYVEFPDGFQFVIFSHNNVIKECGKSTDFGGIEEDPKILEYLNREILNRRQEFEDEFTRVATATETEMIYDPNVTKQNALKREKILLWGTKTFHREDKRPVKLTYEDFAKIKAYHLYHKAFDYMKATEKALGYKNNDHDGFAYGFYTERNLKIYIVGFDLEYMIKTSPGDYLRGKFFYTSESFNRIQTAAYLALLERDKYFLEKALN